MSDTEEVSRFLKSARAMQHREFSNVSHGVNLSVEAEVWDPVEWVVGELGLDPVWHHVRELVL